MGFQQVCENAVVENDGALGCVLIDLRTGLTLASAQRRGAELDGAEVKTILRSCEELFCGKLIEQFVATLATGRASASGFVREVQITKTFHYQFMAALPGWDDAVMILITEKTLNLGLAWMVVHQTQARLAEARRNVGADRMNLPGHSSREDTAQNRQTGARDSQGERDREIRDSTVPAAPVASNPAEPSVPSMVPVPPTWREASESAETAETPASPGAVRQPAPSAAPVERAMPVASVTAADAGDGQGQRAIPVASAPNAGEQAEDSPESGQTVAAGPRARMFRTHKNKNKKKRGS